MTDPAQIQPPVASNSENAVDSVLVLNKDLFFGVTIANTLRALGYLPESLKSVFPLALALVDRNDIALVIVDIAAVDDWDALRTALDAAPAVPSIAFGSHTNVDGLRSAKRIGIDRVFSNGEFHRTMGQVIERYAHSPGSTGG